MNSIILEVPSTLETERLVLRAPSYTGDGSVVNDAIKGSINELKAWLPFAQVIPTAEETEINLREAHMKFLQWENFRFLIFLKETQEFVGTASLQSIDWDIRKCEIGYWANTKCSGNGYITEAVQVLTNFGMNQINFNRIEIRCESINFPSRAIPEKLGYKLEGILINDELSSDGKNLTDTCIYAVTQSRSDKWI